MRRLAATLGIAMALTLALGNVALADHLRATCEVRATTSAKIEQGYVLDVRLHTSDGRPVNETTVRFYEIVELFGKREMYIGSAITDGQGNTSITYLPAQVGTHEIVARSRSKDHFSGAEGRTSFEATVSAPSYRPEGMPLSAFTAVVPFAVGAVVVGVWALIAFALFATARGVRRGARDHANREDLA